MLVPRHRSPTPARLRPGGDDGGFALVTVMAAMMLLSVLVTAAIGQGLSTMPLARRAQDARAAVAAAQAGIDDYRRRVNATDSYWTLGADPANPAFTGSIPVPGTSSPGTFTYQLVTSVADTTANNLIRLRSTGTVNGVRRSVTADLRKTGFLKYVSFSDKQTVDPALYGDFGYNQGYDFWYSRCGSKYWYTGRSAGGCFEPYLPGDEVVDGPFHTNDSLKIEGSPLFKNPIVESSWAAGCPSPANSYNPSLLCYRQEVAGSAPSAAGYAPRYAPEVRLPPTNDKLKADAAAGCLYTGPTRIVFNGDGTMTVTSPSTKSTNAACYVALPVSTPQTIPVPNDRVIYVQGIPASSGDANYSNPTCGNQVLGQFPPAGDTESRYDCRAGDAFVEGTLRGRVTIGAANDVVVTGDTVYADGVTGNDVLGLVANNNVTTYHPVRCNPYWYATYYPWACENLPVKNGQPLRGHRVMAAILSVNHSFTVQNIRFGPMLSTSGDPSTYRQVTGSVSERYAGLTGIYYGPGTITGYNSVSTYDPRLLALPPPRFLEPTEAAWELVSVTETPV